MLEATSARKHARPQILADAAALRDLLLRPSHTESLLVLAGPEKMGDAVNFCASLLRLKLLDGVADLERSCRRATRL